MARKRAKKKPAKPAPSKFGFEGGASKLKIDKKLVDLELKPDGMLLSGDENQFAGSFPAHLLIPKNEWRDKIAELQETDPFPNSDHPRGCWVANHTLREHVFNQSPESSCVYNGGCGAMMRRFSIQNGKENALKFSPMSGYCRVTRNRHSGSYVWECMEELRDVGILPSSTFRNQADLFEHTFHENTPFVQREQLPSGWPTTAKLFRVLKWASINSVEEYGSALLNQYPMLMGRSGHSMVAEDLVWDNGFYARICDSYGYANRDGTGRVYDSEWTMERSTGGAWACIQVTRPDNLFEWQLEG